jgi:hypothetical protein
MKRIPLFFPILSLLAIVLAVSGAQGPVPSPLKILLSNDDGIDAPGLMVLFERLSSIAQVTVAAPTQNYGGFGHAMTFSDPILVNEFDKKGAKWYAVKATPPRVSALPLTLCWPRGRISSLRASTPEKTPVSISIIPRPSPVLGKRHSWVSPRSRSISEPVQPLTMDRPRILSSPWSRR